MRRFPSSSTMASSPRSLPAQGTYELGKLAQLERPSTRADKLNEYEFYYGTPTGSSATWTDTGTRRQRPCRRGEKVITQDARLIVRVLPDQPQRDTTPRDQRRKTSLRGVHTSRAADFQAEQWRTVMLWSKRELPLVAVEVLLHPGGPLDEPAHAGRTELTATMLGEARGTWTRWPLAMRSRGWVQPSARGEHRVRDRLNHGPQRNFEKAAGLMAQAIEHPRMETSDWSGSRTCTSRGFWRKRPAADRRGTRGGPRALR